jgi:cell division protein FtsB
MPKVSRWKAAHVKCQAAVDDVKAALTAEIERLVAENAELRAKVASLEDADSEGARP